MDCHFPSLTKFEENSPVELVTVLVSVLGEVFTKYRGVKDWRDVILREGAEGWLGNLCIETRATFDVNVLILIFGSNFKVLNKGISTDFCSLFSWLSSKFATLVRTPSVGGLEGFMRGLSPADESLPSNWGIGDSG
jgi:hypothetical protein